MQSRSMDGAAPPAWRRESVRAAACAVLGATLLACGSDSRPLSPTAPVPAPAPTVPAGANFVGEAIVTARSGEGGCGWGTRTGEVRQGVFWGVEIRHTSVMLAQDVANAPTDHLPYEGTLRAREFSAFYLQGGNFSAAPCQFREAWLEGSFDESFTSFEARETLIWGAPGNETRVERRWRVRRL